MRAQSGAQALTALAELVLRDRAVALIVTDQRMPELTGIEMLAAARQHVPEAKFLLLTAYADTDVAIRAINDIGLDYYLLKPWDPPEERLYPVIDDLLERLAAGAPAGVVRPPGRRAPLVRAQPRAQDLPRPQPRALPLARPRQGRGGPAAAGPRPRRGRRPPAGARPRRRDAAVTHHPRPRRGARAAHPRRAAALRPVHRRRRARRAGSRGVRGLRGAADRRGRA